MVIITGATGHIGNNVVRTFIEHQITCKLLLRRLGPALEGLKIDYAIGNIFDPSFLSLYVHEGDTFIHIAGVIDLTKKNRQASEDTNVQGSQVIADYCATHKVHLVYVSSVDAINKPNNGEIIHEPTEFDIAKIKSHYAKSKATGTAYVLDLINDQHLYWAIVYPSAVIGVHDYKPSAAGLQVYKALKHPILPYIKGGYNFIDVRDTSMAIYQIAMNKSMGSFILSGHEMSIKGFYQTINRVTNRHIPLMYIPILLARVGTLFMKNISNVMLDALLENYHYDNHKMVHELGVQPRPFEETVLDLIQWFNQRNAKSL